MKNKLKDFRIIIIIVIIGLFSGGCVDDTSNSIGKNSNYKVKLHTDGNISNIGGMSIERYNKIEPAKEVRINGSLYIAATPQAPLFRVRWYKNGTIINGYGISIGGGTGININTWNNSNNNSGNKIILGDLIKVEYDFAYSYQEDSRNGTATSQEVIVIE